MATVLVFFILAVISIALAFRSLMRMNRQIHEVDEAGKKLAQGKVIFHSNHTPLSSESSEEK